MNIAKTKTFRSGDSVAVELPDGTGFEAGTEVESTCHGDTVVVRRLRPKMTGRELADALEALPMPSRIQEREPIEFPDRPGL